ncbi:MAG: oligoendopeptidase F [Rubrivivax sp.]|jgi:oligoendopeptidase F|nr:oligoendopeptidase F [Rubrivivax sp.]
MPQRPARSEVPPETTWDLSELFASDADWAAECSALDEERLAMKAHQGRLASSATALLDCLAAVEALQVRLVRVGSFAHLRLAQDGTAAASQAAQAQVSALHARVAADLSFVDTEILAFPEGLLERFRAEEPGLAAFSRWLDELLAQRPYRLGAEAERVLASLGTVLGAPMLVYNRAKLADMRFAPFVDAAGTTHANSINGFESQYEGHADASVRHAAWASFSEGLKAYQHTCAATFATETQKNVVLARLRGHASTEAYLLQSHEIPQTVYQAILDIIQTSLAPHMQRYARLRCRVLGLPQLRYCDLKAPLDADFNPPVPYDEACALILQALSVMGPEYHTLMQRALSERWVDRADNIGKSSGAFCASPYGVHPYILITWSDTMRNVFTLAHELGHAGHFGLAMRAQRYVNTRPAMPFIEAPSTMNEMLLAEHILARTADPRMRRAVIMQVLGTYHHNFVTHLLEAELQRQVYALVEQGGSLTAALLNERKGQILQRFWGDTLQLDDGARMTWMRQPHYYMGLYPYTYSVGLVASTAAALRVRQEGPVAVGRWLEVLKAGGTQPPLQLLAAAGIDLSTPQPIHDAVAYVGGLIDELETLFA